MISPNLACSIFTDATRSASIPLQPEALLRTKSHILRWHGHIIVGDVALRLYKHKNLWKYDERAVRQAAQALVNVDVDPGDLVEVVLPVQRQHEERLAEDAETRDRMDWRGWISSWMYDEAFRKQSAEDGPFSEPGEWRRIGENGLPGGLTWTEFVSTRTAQCTCTIAGTRPLELLTRSEGRWWLPRAYAEVLDRWEQMEEKLIDRARVCSRCGARGPRWSGWRTPTSTGYVTMCPPCSGAEFIAYTGHLRGVPYGQMRARKLRADDYLCRLCQSSRASVWDHCHDHDLVRGPVCASCNTFEGKGIPEYLLQREEVVAHLLECTRCRGERTLPSRFHAAVAQAYLEAEARHASCPVQPRVRLRNMTETGHIFDLYCDRHWTKKWKEEVSAAEAFELVYAFVDQALMAGRPETDVPGPRATSDTPART
ncbi:endonuclease domain-containing protein [Streptomyces phaeoluteigriseus]|uniref:endonuclease domain-containing protein n=1 Tax=Streptomyces phaeoluteigriseus TaxID=114686 RepID=UPI0036A99387